MISCDRVGFLAALRSNSVLGIPHNYPSHGVGIPDELGIVECLGVSIFCHAFIISARLRMSTRHTSPEFKQAKNHFYRTRTLCASLSANFD